MSERLHHLGRGAEHRSAHRTQHDRRAARREQLLDRRERRAHRDLGAHAAQVHQRGQHARDRDRTEAGLAGPVLGLVRIPGQPHAEPVQHACSGQPALGRHTPVGEEQHAHAGAGGDQPRGDIERREALHAVVRRAERDEAGHLLAGDRRLGARGACEGRQLLHRDALHAHQHEEGRDLDLALVAREDRRERVVRFLEGQVAPVLAARAEDAHHFAEAHSIVRSACAGHAARSSR